MNALSTMPDNLVILNTVRNAAALQRPDVVALDAPIRQRLTEEMGREVRLTNNYRESEALAEQMCSYATTPYVLGYDIDEDCWYAFTERKPVEVTFVRDEVLLTAAADEARYHGETVQVIDDLVFIETDHKVRIVTHAI